VAPLARPAGPADAVVPGPRGRSAPPPRLARRPADPIDLGTIKARIEKGGHYKNPAEVREDALRVFANAREYNPPGSDVHIMASTLADRFKDRWREQVQPQLDAERAHQIGDEVAAVLRKAEGAVEAALAGHGDLVQAAVGLVDAFEGELVRARSHAASLCVATDPAQQEALGRTYAALGIGLKELVGSVLPAGATGEVPLAIDPSSLDALTVHQMAVAVAAAAAGPPGAEGAPGPGTPGAGDPATAAPAAPAQAGRGEKGVGHRWQVLGAKRKAMFDLHGLTSSNGAPFPGAKRRGPGAAAGPARGHVAEAVLERLSVGEHVKEALRVAAEDEARLRRGAAAKGEPGASVKEEDGRDGPDPLTDPSAAAAGGDADGDGDGDDDGEAEVRTEA